jgi:hypothetical protein
MIEGYGDACVSMREGYGDSKEFAFCERFTLASPRKESRECAESREDEKGAHGGVAYDEGDRGGYSEVL